MKRVLITGKTSYIGTSFASYIKDNPEYQVDTISVRGEDWKTQDFSVYDVVLHVAGIAHKKETKENQQEYFDVNYTLTKELGKKAKDEGVSQFIYLSSMSVYGITEGVITKDTVPNPTSAYGKSKLEAEKYLETLQSDDFIVAIIRPPMVYGKDCSGNYAKLSKLAKKTPAFIDVKNKRSMIFIDNLSQSILFVISNDISGIVYPQNLKYVQTTEMVCEISKLYNKRLIVIKVPVFLLKLLKKNRTISKIFGDLTYDIDDKSIVLNSFIDFKQTIRESEDV